MDAASKRGLPTAGGGTTRRERAPTTIRDSPTRTTNASVVDHLLSTFVLVAYLAEFLLARGAAHPVFFILMLISFIDVLAGFSVSLRAAGRDVNLN